MLTKTQPTETIGEVRLPPDPVGYHFWRACPGPKARTRARQRKLRHVDSTSARLLNRMCSEGLIVAEGQRGFEVAPSPPPTFGKWPNCGSC